MGRNWALMEFRFYIDEKSVKSFRREHSDPALVSWIEALFELRNGETVYLSDENMSLLELGLQLEHWLLRTAKGKPRDFHYHCIDWEDDEGFILEYLCQDSDLWVVESVWRKSTEPIRVTWQELRNATAEFIDQLKTQLVERYHVDWDTCLKYEIRTRIFPLRGE